MKYTCLLLLTVLLNSDPPAPSIVLDGECVRVIDGDTIVVRSTIEYHVRLIDCWAPEARTKDPEEKQRGLAAKTRMNELAHTQKLRIAIPIGGEVGDSITMGRVLGRAWLNDGRELSEIMVNDGLATKSKQGANE